MNDTAPAIEISLQAYQACVDELESSVADMKDVTLDLSIGQGWTIRQIIHHVADGDDIWKNCILLILGNPGAEFHLSWYWNVSQDEWVDHWRYDQRDIQHSLARFRINRKTIADLLRMRPEAWLDSALIHWPGDDVDTKITIADVIQLQTNHVNGHCANIRAIRQKHAI